MGCVIIYWYFSTWMINHVPQTCVARAWDVHKPLYVAPAMNTLMWLHPHTERQLRALRELGIGVIDPISKTLACGDTGIVVMLVRHG